MSKRRAAKKFKKTDCWSSANCDPLSDILAVQQQMRNLSGPIAPSQFELRLAELIEKHQELLKQAIEQAFAEVEIPTMALLLEGPHSRARMLRDVYKLLPVHAQQIPVTVFEVHPNKWRYGSSGGMYTPKDKKIELRIADSTTERYLRELFAHELGHHYWYTQLSGADWSAWQQVWKQDKQHLPTSYAKKNHLEGFGECFAFYLLSLHLIHPLREFLDARLKI